MTKKTCPNCQSLNVEASVFCIQCGTKIEEDSPKKTGKSQFSSIYQRSVAILRQIVLVFLIILGVGGFIFCGYYLLRTNNPDVQIGFQRKADEITETTFRSSQEVDLGELNRSYLVSDERANEIQSVSAEKLYRDSEDYARELVVFDGVISKLDIFEYSEHDLPPAEEGAEEPAAEQQQTATDEEQPPAEEASILTYAGIAIWVPENEKELLVVYRGSADYFQIGDHVEITGVVNGDPAGVIASQLVFVVEEDKTVTFVEDNIFYITLAAMVWMVMVILMILARSRRSRTRAIQILAIMGLGLMLGGCEIHYVTEIKPDGSGVIGTTFVEAAENVDFLRQVPLTLDMFESWKMQARPSGITTANYVQGEMETFYIQRTVDNFEELSRRGESEIEQGQWIFFDRTHYGDYESFRYEGFIDTSILLDIDPALGSQAVNEMTKQIKEIQIDYSVILPGEVVYHNADAQDGNKLTWEILIEEGRYVVAESQLDVVTEPVGISRVSQIMIILLAMFGLFTLLLLVSAIVHRDRVR